MINKIVFYGMALILFYMLYRFFAWVWYDVLPIPWTNITDTLFILLLIIHIIPLSLIGTRKLIDFIKQRQDL